MKAFPRSRIVLLALVALPALAADKMTVTVTHEFAGARPAETIVVPWSEITKRLTEPLADHLAVRDAKGTLIPSQFTNFDPDDKKGHVDEVLFQHDFAAGEKSATFTLEKMEKPVPPFPMKTFARYVPERLDDFAWENDRMGHRTYGPAIEQPSAGKEKLWSSGLDLWPKRVRYLIVDRWYLKGHDNYHKDTGEGLDLYGVAASRGAGGTGIWDGKKLHVSHNWKTWKILANGPVRSIFELTYEWDPVNNEPPIKETKRFTVDAGKNFDQMESTFSADGERATMTVGIGIAKHTKDIETADPITENKEGCWLSLWEKYTKDGQLGTAAIIDPASFIGFASDDLNHLALAKATAGKPLRYWVGGGWDRSGDFPDKAAWEKYVADFAARLKSPVTLSYSDAK